MVSKWHYATLKPDERGLNETKGYACEVVAWRFLTQIPQHDLIDYLLYELPSVDSRQSEHTHGLNLNGHTDYDEQRSQHEPDECSSLISNHSNGSHQWKHPAGDVHESFHTNGNTTTNPDEKGLSVPFAGLNALEIATVGGAKKFLSQRVVQNIIDGVWSGDIVFWHSLNIHSEKRAEPYDRRYVLLVIESMIAQLASRTAVFSEGILGIKRLIR